MKAMDVIQLPEVQARLRRRQNDIPKSGPRRLAWFAREITRLRYRFRLMDLMETFDVPMNERVRALYPFHEYQDGVRSGETGCNSDAA